MFHVEGVRAAVAELGGLGVDFITAVISPGTMDLPCCAPTLTASPSACRMATPGDFGSGRLDPERTTFLSDLVQNAEEAARHRCTSLLSRTPSSFSTMDGPTDERRCERHLPVAAGRQRR